MWAIQPANQHNYIPNVAPQIGTAYQYFLYRTGAGVWRFQVARLDGVVIVNQVINNAGLDGGQLAAGGKVLSPAHQNDMGVAGLLSLRYMNDQNQWVPWNGPFSTLEDRPYHVVEINPYDGNNIQIYGNNGNPVPPGAPCP